MKKLRTPIAIMIVFVLVGAGIGTAVFYTKDDLYSYAYSTVSYSFNGAILNKTPEGKNFNATGIISKESYEEAASKIPELKEYTFPFLQSNIHCVMGMPEDSIDMVIKNKSWRQIESFCKGNSYNKKTMNTTVYLRNYSSITEKNNMSGEKLKNACSLIVNAYANRFKNENGARFDSKISGIGNDKNKDYLEHIYDIYEELQKMQEYAEGLREKATGFGFDVQKEAEETISKINTLRSGLLKNTEEKIIAEGITNNKPIALSTYDEQIERLEYDYSILNARAENYAEWISKFENDRQHVYRTVKLNIIMNEEDKDKIYAETVASYKELLNEKETIEEKIKKKKEIRDNISNNETTEDQKIEIQDLTGNIEEQIKSIVNGPMNILTNTYNDQLFPEGSIQVSETKLIDTNLFGRAYWTVLLPFICGSAIIGLVAAFVAYILNKHIEKRYSQKVHN